MSKDKPQLFADSEGVWREEETGKRSGITWDEIYAVSGHKLDGITEVYTIVALDFEYGEFIELFRDWPGFGQVIAALTERLPGIDPSWFKQVQQLGIDAPALTVWQRA